MPVRDRARVFSRVPTTDRLVSELKIDRETARVVRRVLRGEIDGSEVSEPTAAWLRQCYTHPTDREIATHAADVLIGGHGVEAIGLSDDGRSVACEYSNAGDPYVATLAFVDDRAIIASWEYLATRYGGTEQA